MIDGFDITKRALEDGDIHEYQHRNRTVFMLISACQALQLHDNIGATTKAFYRSVGLTLQARYIQHAPYALDLLVKGWQRAYDIQAGSQRERDFDLAFAKWKEGLTMSSPTPNDPCAPYQDSSGNINVGLLLADVIGLIECAVEIEHSLTGQTSAQAVQGMQLAMSQLRSAQDEHKKFVAGTTE